MNPLSKRHFDALSEIIKNATNSLVESLGTVIGEEIQPSIPKIELVKKNVTPKTLALKSDNFSVLEQTFTGLVEAEVMVLFAQKNVSYIVQKMLGEGIDAETAQECESEAMCELGNIMLNAYLSSIADAFHTPIDSSLPCYTSVTQDEIAQAINGDTKTDLILVSHIELTMEKDKMEGKVFLLLNSDSLAQITSKVDALDNE